MVKLKKHDWDLFLLSVIALFLELAIIRWLSSEIRIFAYFKNLPLMAAFLGFGVGFYLYQHADRLLKWFPWLFLVLVAIISLAPVLGITHVIFVDPRKYFLLGGGFGDHNIQSIPSILKTIKALLVIVSVFFLVVAVFTALTARLGELLNREKPLAGYSINIGGSIVGIAGFSIVSFLEWPPVIWLCLVLMPLLYFFKGTRLKVACVFLAAILITFVSGIQYKAIWSPYYRISVSNPGQDAPETLYLQVNYDGFQSIQDLSYTHLQKFSQKIQREFSRHYNIPYLLSKRRINSVLILGGGAGNDAAAALRNGARMVDVVEIDPVIARIGQQYHPEKPYTSERVNLFVDDARSFIQKTDRKYDLVVFATLDSHSVFSSLSSLRMDNFVFTEESIRTVTNLLKPGGGIAINFFGIKEWLIQRHYNTLKEVTGSHILTYGDPKSAEILYLAGDLFDPERTIGITEYRGFHLPDLQYEVEPTSDDWPFLFLEKRGIPFHYLMPLLLILLLSFIPLRLSRLRLNEINWHLFFMGAAFLLIETKAVTALALIFGSTWLVNSIVIGSILYTILVANILVDRFGKWRFSVLYSGLFIALLFNFWFSFDILNQYNWYLRVVAAWIIITLPIFFAALIFAKAFATVDNPSKALAANLFGSLIGGLLEYFDMWTGLRWLNIIAVVLYALSVLFLMRQKHRGPTTTT